MSPQNLGQIPITCLLLHSRKYYRETMEGMLVKCFLFFLFSIFLYKDIEYLFLIPRHEHRQKIFPDIFSERNSRQTLSQQQLNHIFSLQYSVRIKIMKIFGFQSSLL